MLDTTDPLALERALRVYPGRALVNSVNGDPESLATVLPLAAKFGAAVVVLALDDAGIPADAQGRRAIVERVREAAHGYGLSDKDLIVDSLVMTAAAEPQAPRVTVEMLAEANAAGLATVLGVSNVSHGLPSRPLLNAAFFDAAVTAGLDAAIINPNDRVVMDAVGIANAARAVGADPDAHHEAWAAWDAAYASALEIAAAGGDGLLGEAAGGEAERVAPREALESAVLRGDTDSAASLVDALVADGTPPEHVIGMVLTPAIQRLGDAYGRGEVFLPQMMVAAEAMKSAVARVKELLPEGGSGTEAGRVAFATVKGDIHSIGKDICVSLLESQGFVVCDLGVDVAVERVLDAAKNVDAVCLSALMTTTLPAMEQTVVAVRKWDRHLPVFVGGAVVTAEWADGIGAGYSADAPGCVNAVREALEVRQASR